MLFFQLLQFIPALAAGGSLSASILLKGPLVNYVGTWGCEVLLDLNFLHILSQTVGSACMAVYRMIIYKFAHRISECKTIRNVLLAVEILLILALLVQAKFVRKLSTSSPLADFCLGQDSELGDIIHLYQGTSQESLKLGKRLKISQTLITTLALFAEIISYIFLYYWKLQDNGFERNRNLTRRQNRLNSITLTGQFVCFILEFVYAILYGQLILMKDSGYHFFSYYFLMVYGVTAWTIMTWSQILASTDMRRYIYE